MRLIGTCTNVAEWGIPESDGGAPLLGYNIAIRDIKKTMWIEVGRCKEDVQKFNVRDLQEGHKYLVRIYARNEVGLSDPLESEEPYEILPGMGKFCWFYETFEEALNFSNERFCLKGLLKFMKSYKKTFSTQISDTTAFYWSLTRAFFEKALSWTNFK